MQLEKELTAAIRAVERASKVCVTVQRALVEGMGLEKGDKSPVTVADFAAQAVVSGALADAFPSDPLVGEEDSAALRDPSNHTMCEQVVQAVDDVVPGLSAAQVLEAIDRGTYEGGSKGRHWTLDPIDGTKGFLRMDQYAVALALIEDGEVVLGVLGCPNLPHEDGLGSLFWAVRGGGAFMRALDGADVSPIHVTSVTDVRRARFCESVEKAHSNQSHSSRIADRLGIEEEPYRIDSQCKYAAVSRGDASIYLRLPTRADYVERIWDHAAGVCIVEEAGGRVTDVMGRALNFGKGRGLEDNKGVIVTNGPLHDQVLDAVRTVLEL